MSTVKKVYPVEGMTCAACSSSVQTILESFDGVSQAGANFASNEAQIEYDPSVVSIEELQEALDDIGFQLILETEGTEKDTSHAEESTQASSKFRVAFSAMLSLPVMIIGMWFPSIPFANLIMTMLTATAMIVFGRGFFVKAFQLARHGMANMDTLVAISTGTAFVYSLFAVVYPTFFFERGLVPHVYFEAAAVVITFILLGKHLEERAKQKTADALRKLVELQPTEVTVVYNNEFKSVSIKDVRPEQVLLIRPGDKVPLDGFITEGYTDINESLLSGEPIPVSKKPGDEVYAGTMNLDGTLKIKVTKEGSQTLLSRIIASVKEAQNSKAPIQKLADRISAVFVPVVIGIAALSFMIWILAGQPEALTQGLISFVTVLVIACPCALGLATPTALMVGVGKAAEKGILVKNVESLEKLRKASVLVLDKTGTLTEGNPKLIHVSWQQEQKEAYKSILKSLVIKSTHPLSKSISDQFQSFRVTELHDFANHSGKGLTAKSNGVHYWIGNRLLAKENGIAIPKTTDNANVFFGTSDHLLASFTFHDPIKKCSKALIEKIRKLGIQPVLLSGDTAESTEKTAKELQIDSFRGAMLPEQKAEYIQKFQKEGKTVAMAGDGINDAIALATADVSIAMGKGADIAIDIADLTLLNSAVEKIIPAIRLSQATVNTIHQNLFWAFIYNIIGIPIAAGLLYPFIGFMLNPMMAGAAMALSSVSVVTNSLRLKRLKLSNEI